MSNKPTKYYGLCFHGLTPDSVIAIEFKFDDDEQGVRLSDPMQMAWGQMQTYLKGMGITKWQKVILVTFNPLGASGIFTNEDELPETVIDKLLLAVDLLLDKLAQYKIKGDDDDPIESLSPFSKN